MRVCGSFLAGTNLHADRHLFGKVVDLSSSRTSFAPICLRDDGYKGIAWWGENDNSSYYGVKLEESFFFPPSDAFPSVRMILHLLRSWKMDQLFLGALILMAVTAKTFKISSRTSNSLLPLRWPFVQSLMMEKLLPGVVDMKAATAVQFKVNLSSLI